METKTIDSQIVRYLPLLGDEEKESLLSVIKSFLYLKKEQYFDDFTNIEQYNKELDEALARVQAGEYLTQAQVEQESNKW